MTNFSFFFSLLVIGTVLVDFYVYRNWRNFTQNRPNLKKITTAYLVLIIFVPITLPAFFALGQWYSSEFASLKSVLIGIWVLWYAPKAVIAFFLVLKDISVFIYWLFGQFQASAAKQVDQPEQNQEKVAPPTDLTDLKRISRAEFIKSVGWSAAGVPFVIVGYSLFKTLYDFRIHEIEIPIKGLAPQLDGLTITQISDLHAGSFFSERPVLEAVDMINQLKADVITITGDYVNGSHIETPMILPALNLLKADLGVYGCLGNHDHYANVHKVTEQVRSTQVDLLVNQHRSLSIDGATLHLLGTDNTGFRQNFADINKTTAGLIPNANGDEARVLLAHDPTYFDKFVVPQNYNIDLMLAGHTHGGQIGIEMGPIRWGLARMAYKRWAGGYHEVNPNGKTSHLYVNRGLGTVGPPIRIGIHPEITLLTLKRV